MEYFDDENNGQLTPDKSLKGYKIIIIVLVCILGALSFQYFRQVNQIRADFAIERDTLNSHITTLMSDYDSLRTENDTITANLNIEKLRADSLLQRINSERNWNRAKLREYEKKFTLLREVMKGYVGQIDSLNKVNSKLVSENISYRKVISSERLRADKAEEMSQELNNKIRKSSVVRARDIRLVPIRNGNKEVTRASRAERLRVDFVLSSNDLTNPGERVVYLRITGPDGYVMAASASSTFSYEGDNLTFSASREIDYKNKDLDVSIFYDGEGITSGTYKIAIYMDGHMIGSVDSILR